MHPLNQEKQDNFWRSLLKLFMEKKGDTINGKVAFLALLKLIKRNS